MFRTIKAWLTVKVNFLDNLVTILEDERARREQSQQKVLKLAEEVLDLTRLVKRQASLLEEQKYWRRWEKAQPPQIRDERPIVNLRTIQQEMEDDSKDS